MGTTPEWEAVLQAAARLQDLVPDTVLVGGSAAAVHAAHRVSFDDDHVLADLRDRFDHVLAALEETDGWVTARVKAPVLILGSLDGVETGIRQLIRRRPLETEERLVRGARLTIPTLEEAARIKGWLILRRNATRDYVDFVALCDRIGPDGSVRLVQGMDTYYADQIGPGGERIATQLVKQLAEPLPYDLDQVDLAHFRHLEERWRDWPTVTAGTLAIAVGVMAVGRDPRESAGSAAVRSP